MSKKPKLSLVSDVNDDDLLDKNGMPQHMAKHLVAGLKKLHLEGMTEGDYLLTFVTPTGTTLLTNMSDVHEINTHLDMIKYNMLFGGMSPAAPKGGDKA